MNTNYMLPLPPVDDQTSELTGFLATHDQYSLSEVPLQLDIVDGLTVQQARELLDNLERTRAEHEARARNAESAQLMLRDRLAEAAAWNRDTRSLVGSAEHTSRLDTKNPGVATAR